MSSPRAAWVGREREIEHLERLVAGALEGRGGCALIVGEAGIGKTRLLEHVAERARERGLVCAWGRGWELGGAPSFWPWLELLRTLFERPRSPLALARRLEPLLAAAPTAGTDGRDAFALFDVTLAYLQAHARAEPLMLLLDDLHAVDPSSLALAELLARRLGGERVVLLGSQRTPQSGHAELELRLSRLGQAVERIALAPLTRDEVARWMALALGTADVEIARRVHDASDGNPLFVSELLRLPLARERLGVLPASLRALIRERLAALGRERSLLATAALVGRQFTLPLLAEVAAVPSAALESSCHDAVRAGVLEALAPGHYRFSHALVAETLVSDLEPALRTRLHRRAAEALERRHASDPAAPVNEIARHWLEAGVEAAPRAVAAAERAAQQASQRLAFSDAAWLYERALEALALCSPLDARRQGELLVGRVEALSRAGRREHAESVCAQAVELARAAGDGELLARAALALGAESSLGKADLTVARLLERALGWLPEGDGELRALVSARLASARQPEVDPDGPMTLARSAIGMARRSGTPATCLQVIHSALGALMDFAPAEERAALNAEALELATRLGDHPRALAAARRLAFDRLELVDVGGFERAVARYEALAAELEQPRHAWVPAMFRAMRADWEGDRERAERWEQEARARRDQGNGEGAALVPARPLARALLHADAALLERFVGEVAARSPGSSGACWLSALLAAWRGELDVARAALDTLAARGLSRFVGRAAPAEPAGVDVASHDAPLADPSHAVGLGYLLMPEIAVELACHLGDEAWAQALYRDLLPLSGTPFLLTTVGFSLHGAVDHALLRLAIVERRWDVAERHAARALELCTRLRAQPLLARIQRDSERLARARAAPETHPPTMHSPAMHGDPAQRESVAPHDDGLRLLLEGDYWSVSAQGVTCRVQDNRGMHMLARLVEQPGRELHVLDLSGSPSGVDGSDAGELLDARARREYEERLRDLASELDEASGFNDLARQARLTTERDALLAELARGFGLGGRPRRGASAVERARVNVRRRLTLALRRIRGANPALAEHVEASLRTGVFCVYEPRPWPRS